MSHVFTVAPWDGVTPVKQYHAMYAHPAPGYTTLATRQLDPDALLLPGEGSAWRTMRVGEVLDMLAQENRLSQWLREDAKTDCTAEALAPYTDRAAPASMRSNHSYTLEGMLCPVWDGVTREAR